MSQVGPTTYFWRVPCPPRAVAVALVACFCLTAADWPRFRGPNGAGSSGAKGLPVEFGRHKNVAWKRSVPAGKSSPVIAGERIFLTAHEGDKRIVLCLDRESGAELWRRHVIAERTEPRHPLNDPASPTPVSDGANVYAFFSEFGLAAYGPNGELLWRVPLGPFEISQGMGASPILADGKVILIADQAKSSYLAAFDTDNGEMLWKTERPDGSGAFSTPTIRLTDSAEEIVVSGQTELAGYSANTGEKLWWLPGFAKLSKGSPTVGDGVIYINVKGIGEFVPDFDTFAEGNDVDGDGQVSVAEAPDEPARKSLEGLDTNGDGTVSKIEYDAPIRAETAAGGVWAVLPRGDGEQSESSVLWRYQKALPNVPTPLFHAGATYLVRNGGIFTSLDANTGAVHKQGRLREAMGHYYASPIVADGKIYVVSEAGKVVVIRAIPEWEVLATNDLQENVYATPAVAADRLYIRTMSALYCFDRTASKSTKTN